MLAQQCLVILLLLTLLLRDGGAWWTRRRKRRRAPPPCHGHDCKISQWSHWSECSHRCGSAGTQYRTRWKTAHETCGGTCYYSLKEERKCDVYPCQNGGTPSYGRCSCRTGYAGTCCELVTENRNDKANPSQSKVAKDVGIPVGCSVGGVCLATILGLIFRYYKKNNRVANNTPPNQEQGGNVVFERTVEQNPDNTIRTTERVTMTVNTFNNGPRDMAMLALGFQKH